MPTWLSRTSARPPKTALRLLNHWDNLDRHVERGYSGASLWDWWRLPDIVDPRYTDYARANASLGINGTVLNNGNAKAESLTTPYLAKAAALAGVFRPYGIKVWLSARLSAPRGLGGLRTADPPDPAVRAWWKAKVDEIYAAIPDFGGFLVKANSEGQPGPQDYGRNHADGANMLAEALEPHGGVANIATDRNWSGSQFDQANWHAFGRLAWDPDLKAATVARDWVAQTFTPRPAARDAIVDLMLASREAVVDYMTPLGLHHLMDTGHHYGPGPWVDNLERADWNPTYFHKAGRSGMGFDRTASGSNAVAQYAPPLARLWSDPRTTPPELLLWFHHLPWDHAMPSGRTLWAELVARYDRGVATVDDMGRRWAALRPDIDPQRHAEVSAYLAVQAKEARWWRDACIAYFQSVSGLPLPAGVRPPEHGLQYYKGLRFGFAPGRG